MKKSFFLCLMSSVVCFNSCSSTDDNEAINGPSDKKILLSKITTIYYDNPANPETNVASLSYNNQGQLIKTVSEGRTSAFEYDTAGKPVKTNYYKADGSLDYYSSYAYNGDQLVNIKAIYSNPDFNRTITYTYNNGKVATSTLCQSADCSHPSTSSYTYSGDNISVETSVTGGTLPFSHQSVFSYDNKLNPFSYTNKYFRISMGGAYVLSSNNYTMEKMSYKDNAGNWIESQKNTYDIQYNNNQLPTQVIGKEANGNKSVQYNYEYIIQ